MLLMSSWVAYCNTERAPEEMCEKYIGMPTVSLLLGTVFVVYLTLPIKNDTHLQ